MLTCLSWIRLIRKYNNVITIVVFFVYLFVFTKCHFTKVCFDAIFQAVENTVKDTFLKSVRLHVKLYNLFENIVINNKNKKNKQTASARGCNFCSPIRNVCF